MWEHILKEQILEGHITVKTIERILIFDLVYNNFLLSFY